MRALAGVAAVALVASLWLPWFGTGGVEGAYFNREVEAPAFAGVFVVDAGQASGWEASVPVAVVLVVLAAVVLLGAAWRPRAPRGLRGAAVVGAVAAVALVAVRLVRPPGILDLAPDDLQLFGALDRITDVRFEPAWGAWAGLAAAVVAAAASIAAARRPAR